MAAAGEGTSLTISLTMSSCLNIHGSLLSTILFIKILGFSTSIWHYTQEVDSHIWHKMTKVAGNYRHLVIFYKQM